MHNQAVLLRIDVRVACVRNNEVQTVWRERAVEQMMRRASVLGAWLSFRVAERAHNVFLESRPCTVVRNGRAGPKAPRIVGELLSGCRWNQGVTCHRPRQRSPASQKCTPVEQTIPGNCFQICPVLRQLLLWSCHRLSSSSQQSGKECAQHNSSSVQNQACPKHCSCNPPLATLATPP